MKAKQVQLHETYLFVATDDPQRKAMEGKPFTPVGSNNRYTYKTGMPKKEIKFFFDEENRKARPEELEEMPDGMLYRGLKFHSQHFEGMVQILEINEVKNTLSVEISRQLASEEGEPVQSWREDDWNLLHTKVAFERGEYWQQK